MRDHIPPRSNRRRPPAEPRGGDEAVNGDPTAPPTDPRAAERTSQPADLLAAGQAGDARQPAQATTTDPQRPPAAPEVGERSGEEPAHPGVPLAPPGVIPESDVRVHSPAAAQPHHHLGLWAEELGELPWTYGDGRLVTLLRDPRTIFVSWDLSQQQIEQAFGGLGAARAMLKLWTAPQGGEFLREMEVHLEARGWYVRELLPGLDLRVELWAVGERGARMIRAARPVRLPPAEA